MSSTRKGKIARLPKAVREQLNRRLDDGESGPDMVRWLNGLPEVQSVVQNDFEGRPVREQNLSEWRQGGYEDWQRQQEALDWAREVTEEATDLAGQTAKGSLADHLSLLAVVAVGRALRTLAAEPDPGPEERRELLALCQELAKLRRGDHELEWLRLEREVVALRQQDSVENRKKLFAEWASDPVNREQICGSKLTEEEKQTRMHAIFGIGALPGEQAAAGGESGAILNGAAASRKAATL